MDEIRWLVQLDNQTILYVFNLYKALLLALN